MLFIAFNAAVDLIKASSPKDYALSDDPLLDDEVVSKESSRFKSKSELRRRSHQSIKNVSLSTPRKGNSSLKLYSVILIIWQLKWKLLISFFPFVLVLFGFMAFVFLNGGIVLGNVILILFLFFKLVLIHPFIQELKRTTLFPYILLRLCILVSYVGLPLLLFISVQRSLEI